MDPFNGQQMPQINNDSNSGQRNDIYANELRGYGSPPYNQQLRRPNNTVYTNNSPMNDQINELTKQTNMMSFGPNEVNYHSIGGGDISNNTRSWIQPEMKDQSPQTSMMNPMMNSNLSPFAKEFVPRQTMSYSSGPPITNGMNWNQTVHEVNPDCDDFIALSYLKEFIDTITIKPNKFESGIAYLTEVLNTYIDEDDSIMDSVVNLIVDQAIIEPQFRYNGVRLCINLIQNLMVLSEDKEFKFLLFRRCEREYSRREHLIKASPTTEQYLRGLTMFIGDLYSRLEAPELASLLPQLLLTLLSKPDKENLKCVCQVLKLCGQLLERHFSERKSDDVKRVMDRMEVCINEKDINQYMKELMTNIVEMQKRGWTASMPASDNASNHVVNPYLDATPESNWGDYTEEYNNYSDDDEFQLARYDFGQCGDEEDTEVCDAFEEFLKNSGQTK